jgi:hypothetical protein
MPVKRVQSAQVRICKAALSGAARFLLNQWCSSRIGRHLTQAGGDRREISRYMDGAVNMIGIGRSIRISGDPIAAMAFARDMVEHIKKWPGVTRAVCWQGMSGPTGALVFFSECADLATLDKINTNMMEDKAYWGKVAEARKQGLFDLSSSQDMLMRQL